MNRREILNELQQIVAVTDTVGPTASGALEVARRAKGLIQVIESWPIAFPPAPFVSDQCAERHHGDCLLGTPNSPFAKLCKCACHCPPEAPQQPGMRTQTPHAYQAHNSNDRCIWCEMLPTDTAFGAMHSAETPQQPTELTPATARHIDTPDELLELLAGVSSDPQIEGLSLSQKASTMALLYAAKALQQIADSQGHFDSGEIADAILICCGNLDEDKSPADPAQPS